MSFYIQKIGAIGFINALVGPPNPLWGTFWLADHVDSINGLVFGQHVNAFCGMIDTFNLDENKNSDLNLLQNAMQTFIGGEEKFFISIEDKLQSKRRISSTWNFFFLLLPIFLLLPNLFFTFTEFFLKLYLSCFLPSCC